MILTKSPGYWSTGITLTWTAHAGYRDGEPHPGWSATADYLDDGFCSDETDMNQVSTEGVLRTRYAIPDGATRSALTVVIYTMLADAAKLGITFTGAGLGLPMLYYRGDGEDADYPPPPGWHTLLIEQAKRIGWATYGYLGESGRVEAHRALEITS